MTTESDDLGFDLDAAVDEMVDGLGFDGAEAGQDQIEDQVGAAVDDAVVEVDGPVAQTEITEPAVQESPQPATEVSDEAPRTWSPEEAKHWAGMSPEARAAVLRREADMFKGIEQYKGEASIGRDVRKLLMPYREVLERERIDPMGMIGNLVNAHARLSMGQPHEKIQMMHQIMADYGVNLEQLAGIAEVPMPNPEIQGLQNQLAQLHSQVQGYDQQRREAQRSEVEQQIRAFAADPSHPHFNEVSDDITALIRSGVSKTLQDAYEKAVWANPVTRAKEQARLQTAQAEAAKKAAQEKAKSAKMALAANVRTTAKKGSAAAPLGSLDDTLNEVFAEIKARS